MATAQIFSEILASLPIDIKPNSAATINVVTIEDISDVSTSPTSTLKDEEQISILPKDLSSISTSPTNSHKSDTTGPLISASLITTDFDALRFDAAASLQIVQSQTQSYSTSTPRSHRLISSPYNDPNHLLDLRTLDTQSRLLSKALAFMKPIKEDYAIADYMTSFNWDEILDILRTLATTEGHVWREQDFYTVIFRSRLRSDIDEQRLHDLDKDSHREAVESGYLLKYWFGKRDHEERNLATCIWRSKEDARLGGLGPDHKKARMAARELYHEIVFSTWRLVVKDGAEKVKLEEWADR